MPQMSPIVWMIPLTMMMFLMLSTKASVTWPKEQEEETKMNKTTIKINSWKW